MSTMNTKRRLVWASGGLIVVLALAYSMAPKPLPADFAEVTRQPMEVTLDHEGKTRLRERFAISAPFSGRIERVELEPGDRVEAGETVLVTLRPNRSALLDPASHEQAAASVRASEADVKATLADEERARAASELATRERDRLTRLVEGGFVSEIDADQAETRVSEATAAYRAARAAVHAAQFQLEAARARLKAGTLQTEGTQETIEIRSPIDGVVLLRHLESEAAVRTGDPILEVGDPREIEVVADFLSNDAVKMQASMPVRLSQWGGDSDLLGKIRRIEPSGFLKISALGVEEQRVNVVIDLESPHETWSTLGDAFRVEVQVITWQANDVLVVPTNSLFRHQGAWATFLFDGNRASLRPLEIGHRNALQAEVLNGLSDGDVVLVHPSDTIEDGTRVSARDL